MQEETITATIWLLVDQEDHTWEAHVAEHEALRALRGFQES